MGRGDHMHSWWDHKLVSPLEAARRFPQKTKNRSHGPARPPPGVCPEETGRTSKRRLQCSLLRGPQDSGHLEAGQGRAGPGTERSGAGGARADARITDTLLDPGHSPRKRTPAILTLDSSRCVRWWPRVRGRPSTRWALAVIALCMLHHVKHLTCAAFSFKVNFPNA